MKNCFDARGICLGGLFSAVAVLFQSAPVYLAGAGLMLSPFSTLPIALLSFMSPPLGLAAYAASAFILFMISTQEAVIFMLATGLLGLALGGLHKKGFILCEGASAVALFAGVVIMTYLVGIPSFGSLTAKFTVFAGLLFILAFSIVYSWVWQFILRVIIRLLRLKNNSDH
ncbi:MAG: hypothetical protein N2376_04455 [Clostridia bacterium]|nr:hypothetical protein [Clostridia bacterium]